ncbi:MAG: hypothetical protein KAS77_02765, partial [Thermoplasmata archaeon]|nr:hypothetical protein [Thermoplasmata archaeon]
TGAQPEGLGGIGGIVSGNVADGGYARLAIVAFYPTIYSGNDIKAIEGKGGNGTAASAPPTMGGEGSGRTTSNGTAYLQIPMSIPSLIAPPDRFHITLIPRFRWTHVGSSTTNGSLSYYHLQVDDDPNFGSPEITQSTVTSSHAPTSLEHGTYYWRVSAFYDTPPQSTAGWSEVWWFTYGPNRPPVVVNPLDDVVIRENDVDIVIGNANDVFSDPDGDSLMFAVLLDPNIAVTFDEDGNISITPLAGWAGVTEITIIAREMYVDVPLRVLHKVKITVRRSNDPPLITTLNFSKIAYEDNPYWIDFEAIDSDLNDEPVWSLDTTAEWLSIDSGSGRLEGTPRQEHIGTEWVEVIVRDELNESDRVRFQLEVVNTNDDPRILTQHVTQWERDDPYSVSYEAEDLDPTNDVMTWELESNADFLSIDPRTGVLTDSVGPKSPGEYYVEVIVRDGNGGFDANVFHLVIYFDNDPPVVDTIPTVEVPEEEITIFDLAPFIHDEDSGLEELALSCADTAGMSIDGFELTFLYDAWVPDHTFVLSVSDGTSDVAFELDVHVVPVNDPPIIVSVGPHTTSVSVEMDEGETMAFPITVEDEDNDSFDYTVESEWDGIKTYPNGTLEVVTTADDVGVHHAVLTIDDGAGGTDTFEIEITVLDVNYAPGTPSITNPEDGAIYTKGEPIELTASVFDPDMTQGQELTVTWISDISGELNVSQTTLEDIGLILEQLPVGTHRITLKVSDGEFESSTSIGLTVKKVPKETDSFVTSPAGIALIITIIIVITVAGLYLTMRNRTEGRRDGDGSG